MGSKFTVIDEVKILNFRNYFVEFFTFGSFLSVSTMRDCG